MEPTKERTPRLDWAGLLRASGSDCVRDVMVAGRFVVRERHHPAEDPLLTRYRRELDRLLAGALT